MESSQDVQHEEEDGPRSPATFNGRLQLQDFAYGSSQPVPRRNPRRTATSLIASSCSSAAPASSAVASPASRKRQSAASSATSPSSSPTKKKKTTTTTTTKRSRPSASYAPPSAYAHLSLLPDAVAPNLLVLFVGLNPGVETARTGHAYAHPSNLFWKLLHSSGVTPRKCRADEDQQMPGLYSLGLTNIVARPSRNGAELSKQEMDEGVFILEAKARRWRPESMCVVGKGIWESIWRVRHGGPVGKAFRYGWQDEAENMGGIEGEWAGARVFVATSTSGLAASLSLAEKQSVWAELGAWVKMRRAAREVQVQVQAEAEGSS